MNHDVETHSDMTVAIVVLGVNAKTAFESSQEEKTPYGTSMHFCQVLVKSFSGT